MGLQYLDSNGKAQFVEMGCYGIGVSRLAQAAVEQSYDENGIIWPVAIAPYQAIVIIPNINDKEKAEVGAKIYQELTAAGIETLLDDRKERAGVKFKDSELIGIPYRITVGRSLAQGKLEVVTRKTKDSQDIPVEEVVSTIKKWVDEAMSN